MEQDSIESIERQTEVNEWEYNRKLESLFIAQLFFLALVVLVLLSILWKYGLMNLPYILIVGLILLTGLILLWFFRSSYTKNVRDKNMWNRRRFEGDGSLAAAVSPEEVAAEAKKRIAAYEAAAAAGQACPQI
jgi:flagellar biosynthesis/type III secretory pathway M-ring protein FliF/YscJ